MDTILELRDGGHAEAVYQKDYALEYLLHECDQDETLAAVKERALVAKEAIPREARTLQKVA